jgi:hypothetical protein
LQNRITCSESIFSHRFQCQQTQDDKMGLQKRFDNQQKPDSEDYWLSLLAEAVDG